MPAGKPNLLSALPPWAVVWLCFFVTLMVFYSGHLYSDDAVSKIEAARGLLVRGSTAIDMSTGAWGHSGRGGRIYPHFSIGSILMMLPPVAGFQAASAMCRTQLPAQLMGFFVTIFNTLYTATTGMLLFVLFEMLGLSRARAITWSSIIVFCTMILPYSSTGWSEPAAFLWGLAGFVVLISKGGDPSRPVAWAVWACWGVCALAASLIRIEYMFFFLIFLALDALRLRTVHRGHAVAAVLVMSAVVGHLAYNLIRYGSVLNAGYVSPTSEEAGLLEKLIGLSALKDFYWFFLSFGKNHWFWVSPVLALSPFAFRSRQSLPSSVRSISIAALLFLPAYIYLIDTFTWCCMSWCWSYRYFYVTFPYLLIPLAFLSFEAAWFRRTTAVLAVTGFVIAFFATTVNFHVVLEHLVAAYGYDDAMYGRTASLPGAPFWTHVGMFPRLLINSIGVAVGAKTGVPWGVMRTECLDIWPVGLTASGMSAPVAFGAWLLNIAVAALLWRHVIGMAVRRPAASGGMRA